MSASCEWALTMTGRNRNKYVNEILVALYKIENVDVEEGIKIFRVSEGKNFFTKVQETTILTDNTKAKVIWGDNYLEPRTDVCELVAKAAPSAEWVIDVRCISENGGEGCESYMKAKYCDGTLEIKKDEYVDTVTLSYLVQSMNADNDSYESFCECYNVDDSIDEDTYEEYKYADCEDDFYYNAEKKTVSRNHLWEVKAYSIEK